MCKWKQKRSVRIVLSLFFLLSTTLLPTVGCAEMDAKAILKAADQARGNVAGIQWTIELESIESGRTQSRTLQLKARDRNSLVV